MEICVLLLMSYVEVNSNWSWESHLQYSAVNLLNGSSKKTLKVLKEIATCGILVLFLVSNEELLYRIVVVYGLLNPTPDLHIHHRIKQVNCEGHEYRIGSCEKTADKFHLKFERGYVGQGFRHENILVMQSLISLSS
ncbi:hypothetical protein POM88_051118 [Heracleum sosnowskyi]|uniref:Uncharacterized protein n=1 Tax=Heracleum sosnowskyi TaxID=360622 RepID=A0AAD8GYX9_9APIA|nr:hypothetical protein POM88_051118 [Heracleum sosnowskyi]